MRWFARTEQLLGPEGYARLGAARVAVFGLGGVGSYAVEALARAGVGHLQVVDHDVVNPTNLNRQLFALRSTLGRPKVEVARERILDINPDAQVDARHRFINGDSVAELLDPLPDVVVDAIDSLNAKVALMEAAYQLDLPTVSAMGAGGKVRGDLIQAADLEDTWNCPLARLVRKRLHGRGIHRGITCIFTPEPCRNDLPPRPEDIDAHVGPGRKRTPLGTLSYMPALVGLRVAEEVIRKLLALTPLS
ncbi:MAG: tRNA threonylcarbamoyladenosine dehydratase [Acidobacteria bacterium ADurb.Bin340]|nr:MAG: tRNA threonylcarbamoyladenosine dehydratase [Acidobacteria bacterium ADurb.Bin340]